MMLGLWSSAAQSWGCHCRTCIRTTSAIGRRAVTTAPRRRKALASDVFVATYSAVMATAAVLDASYKNKRRAKLDSEIAETKTKLAKLMEDSMASDLARLYESSPTYYDTFVDPVPRKNDDPVHAFATDTKNRVMMKLKQISSREQAKIRRSRKGLFFPRWNDNWKMSTRSLNLCRDAIAAEENDADIRDREPLNTIQFTKMTDMISHLVDQLLQEAYHQTEAEAPGVHPPLNHPESAYNMIRMLKSDGYPSYQHPGIEPGKTIQVRKRVNELNRDNLNALAEWSQHRGQNPRFREHYVAKICYNLLISDVPPGIRNYNSLIAGFTEIGEHRLARVLVDSFLNDSRLRPTTATTLCLLQHYRLSQSPLRFHNTVRRMFGYDWRGLGHRRRPMDDLHESWRLRKWAAGENNVAINHHWAVQLPKLEWPFYEIIMEGLLDFSFVNVAVDVFLVYLRSGVMPHGGLVNKLFHACIESVDSSITHRLVDGLLRDIDNTIYMLFERQLGEFTLGVARKIRRVLAMRSAQLIEPKMDPFAALQGQLDDAPPPIDPVGRLATSTWISCLLGEVEYWTEILTRIEQRVFDPDPETERRPLLYRVERAIEVVDEALERPARYEREAEHYYRMAKLEWLRAQCSASARNNAQLEVELYSITRPQLVEEEDALCRDGPAWEGIMGQEEFLEGKETMEEGELVREGEIMEREIMEKLEHDVDGGQSRWKRMFFNQDQDLHKLESRPKRRLVKDEEPRVDF